MEKENAKLFDFFKIIDQFVTNPNFNNGNVVKYLNPHDLHQKLNFEISETGEDLGSLADYAKKYFEFCVNTGNKQFLNQLYSGFNLPAFIGEVIAAASNTSIYTYEVAPVATEIERELIRLMNTYTGYHKGDGIFLTGGSNANLIAMFSARNRYFPEWRTKGVHQNLGLKAFVNEQAHYSLDTAANLLGIGTENVVKVKADEEGRMIPSELEKAIEESVAKGEKPFFVVATCGTTMLGAFDPIEKMLPICQKHNLWFHVDGAFGGSLILSPKNKHLFRGIEHTDSFAWDAHKVMNVPLMCSVILVKQKGTLQNNITGVNTDYIYHDIDDVEDLGKKSIQCGRRVDALKLWFSWKHLGKEGYAKRIDNLVTMAKYAEEIVRATPQLKLLVPRQSLNICFQYIPKKKVDLNDFNLQIREELRKSGKSIVNFGYVGKTLAIRLVISNGDMQKEDVRQFFTNFLEVAKNIESQLYG